MAKDIIFDNQRIERKPRPCCSTKPMSNVVVDFTQYAPLLPTSILKKGDEYFNPTDNKWHPSGLASSCQKPAVAGNIRLYRRPLHLHA